MKKICSFSLVCGLLLGPPMAAHAAGAAAKEPSTEDIINALTRPADPDQSGVTRQMKKYGPAAMGAPVAPKAAVEERINHPNWSIDTPIFFERNSAQIGPKALPLLEKIADAFTSPKLKDANLLLVGHTDSSGSPSRNQILSEERANAVRDYLVNTAHIDASRINTAGKGQDEPVDPNNPTDPVNRRVVLIHLDK